MNVGMDLDMETFDLSYSMKNIPIGEVRAQQVASMRKKALGHRRSISEFVLKKYFQHKLISEEKSDGRRVNASDDDAKSDGGLCIRSDNEVERFSSGEAQNRGGEIDSQTVGKVIELRYHPPLDTS